MEEKLQMPYLQLDPNKDESPTDNEALAEMLEEHIGEVPILQKEEIWYQLANLSEQAK